VSQLFPAYQNVSRKAEPKLTCVPDLYMKGIMEAKLAGEEGGENLCG